MVSLRSLRSSSPTGGGRYVAGLLFGPEEMSGEARGWLGLLAAGLLFLLFTRRFLIGLLVYITTAVVVVGGFALWSS